MVKLCGQEISNHTVATLSSSIILFVGSIIIIVVASIFIGYAGDIESLPNFGPANCTISKVQVTTLTNCGINAGDYGPPYFNEWIAVWKCKETGASIVENPFAGRFFPQSAYNDQNDYDLDTTHMVMCNTVNSPMLYPTVTFVTGCQVWSTCFFDVATIKYMQENGESDNRKGFILLFTGIGLLVLSGVMLSVWAISIWKKNGYDNI